MGGDPFDDISRIREVRKLLDRKVFTSATILIDVTLRDDMFNRRVL